MKIKHDLTNMPESALIDRIVSDEIPIHLQDKRKLLNVAKNCYLYTEMQYLCLRNKLWSAK